MTKRSTKDPGAILQDGAAEEPERFVVITVYTFYFQEGEER